MGQGVPLRVHAGSCGPDFLVQKQDQGFGNSHHAFPLRNSLLGLEELAVCFQYCPSWVAAPCCMPRPGFLLRRGSRRWVHIWMRGLGSWKAQAGH